MNRERSIGFPLTGTPSDRTGGSVGWPPLTETASVDLQLTRHEDDAVVRVLRRDGGAVAFLRSRSRAISGYCPSATMHSHVDDSLRNSVPRRDSALSTRSASSTANPRTSAAAGLPRTAGLDCRLRGETGSVAKADCLRRIDRGTKLVPGGIESRR
jgi:hypothetical protein